MARLAPLALALLLARCSCAPSPSAEALRPGYVLVEARGLVMEGSPRVAAEALALPRGGAITALAALERLMALGALNFTTAVLPAAAGARAGERVVTAVNGLAAEAPLTAWVPAARRPAPGGGAPVVEENANLATALLLAGDTLALQLVRADEVVGLTDRLAEAALRELKAAHEEDARERREAERKREARAAAAAAAREAAAAAPAAAADTVDLDAAPEEGGAEPPL